MKPDEFKSLVETLSKVIDARAKTTADHLQLAGKVDRIAKNHERRLEALEEKTGTPNPNKH